MEKTSKEFMEWLGLQVGDRVKVSDGIIEKICIVTKNYTINRIEDGIWYPMTQLLDKEIEILPRPIRVGDLKCKDFECEECPLRAICETILFNDTNTTYFEILEKFKTNGKRNFDQEIYDLLKARLDKEVLGND